MAWFSHALVLAESPGGQAGDRSSVHRHGRGFGAVTYHTVKYVKRNKCLNVPNLALL